MKLVIDVKHSEAEPNNDEFLDMLKEAFALTCTELGLVGVDEDVLMTFQYPVDKKIEALLKKAPPHIASKLKKEVEGLKMLLPTLKYTGGGFTKSDARHPLEMTLMTGDPTQMLFTLCHEMVHVQQMVSGRLSNNKADNTVTFEGKKYSASELRIMGDRDSPHEAEAYEKGPKIALKVVRGLSDKGLYFLCFDGINELPSKKVA